MKYRKEIDGLRALAVIPVMLFHAGFNAFSGGFIGVDVFFVISGYLITTIIISEQQKERFSIVNFYERRIRRILPALFLVMFACLPFAWFWMLPSQLIEFAQSLISTSTFLSNILFWMQSGYFDTAAETKPLLHTWSLAVEEQYYLIFPLFLMLVWPLGKRWLTPLVIIGLLLSLGIAEWGWRHHPMANFFLTPSRIWELLIGVLTAFYLFGKENPRGNQFLSLLGLVLILYSVFAFDKTTPFPSLYALVPTIGTALIILFARRNTITGHILSTPIMTGIGLISYSTYLWHQPLFVFARLKIEEPSTALYLSLSLLAMVLGYLSWRFVENPIRRNKNITRKQIFLGALFGTAFIIAIGILTLATDGFKNRYPAKDHYLLSLSPAAQRAYVPTLFRKYDGKTFNKNDGQTKILIIGDSYAQDFMNALYENGALDKAQLSTHTIPNYCGNLYLEEDFTKNINKDRRAQCRTNEGYSPEIIERIKNADTVFIATSWIKWQAELLPRSIENIKQLTEAKVLVIGRKHFGSINIKKFLKLNEEERLTLKNVLKDAHTKTNQIMRETSKSGDFIDLQQIICEEDKKCRVFTPDGKLISSDGGHLTKDGAKFVGKKLIQTRLIRNALK